MVYLLNGMSCMKSEELLGYTVCATLKEELRLSSQFVNGSENKPHFRKVGSVPKVGRS